MQLQPLLKSLPLHASISISTLFLPFLMLSPIYSALSLHPSILFISLFHILYHYSLYFISLPFLPFILPVLTLSLLPPSLFPLSYVLSTFSPLIAHHLSFSLLRVDTCHEFPIYPNIPSQLQH